MRQLKQFLRAKKGICSNECKCITINMWRCADLQGGDEFCGCGDNGGGGGGLQPGNKVYASGEVTAMHIKLFATTPDGEDYISLDVSTYDFTTSGIFNSEGGDALVEILNSSYTTGGAENMRYAPFILGTDGGFPTDGAVGTINATAMSLVKAVLNDPTEANKQNLIDAIDAAIDIIMGQGDPSASFVTYGTTGTTITIVEKGSTIVIGGEEQPIANVVVTPGTEAITATSSDTSLLTVRAEKIPFAPVNAYTIYGVGIAAGTVTVTITGVDDPTVSESFSIEILR